MVGEGRDDRTIRRGLDEVFACQDMVQRAPGSAATASRARAWFAAAARAFAQRGVAHQPAVPPAVPRQSQ